MSDSEFPVLNKAAALERMGDDEEIFNEVLEVFLDDVPKQFEIIAVLRGEASEDALNREEIRRIAHSLKSAAGNVGGEAMQQAAFKLEQAADESDVGILSGLFASLEQEFVTLKAALAA